MVSRPAMPVGTRASAASRRSFAVSTLMRGFVVSDLVVRDLAMRVEEISHEGAFRNRRCERQGNREGRAGTRRAGDIDMAAHGVDQLAHQPQPDAEPAMRARAVRALEPLEDPLLVELGDADAVVPDPERCGIGVAGKRYFDRLSGTELDRVRHDVLDDLREGDAVPLAVN